MIQFKYGFERKGFTFGWMSKDLYRLPTTKKNRFYHFKKLSVIPIGAGFGYRVTSDKLTILQLQSITNQFSKPVIINKIMDKDCPF